MSFISETSLTIIIALLTLKLHITTSYKQFICKNEKQKYTVQLLFFADYTFRGFCFTYPLGKIVHKSMENSQKHVKSIPLTQERTHTCIEEGQTMQCPKEKGQKKTNNDPKNTSQKTKDLTT